MILHRCLREHARAFLVAACTTSVLCTAGVRAEPAASPQTQETPQKAVATDKDLTMLGERLVAQILGKATDVEQVRGIVKSQQKDGSWGDIPYDDRSNAKWKPQTHLSRLHQMARTIVHEGSELTGDAELRAALRRGLDFWFVRDPQSDNWWWRDIGSQLALGELLLVARGEFTDDELNRGAEVLARTKIGLTGQNLLWVSRVNLYRAILTGDTDLARAAIDAMSAEIRISEHEGVQPDMSFHQHGPCLYSLGYGRGFSDDGARVARLVSGTAFALPPEKTDLLVRYLLDGQRWLFRGATGDLGAGGREISRPGWNNRALVSACDDLVAIGAPRSDEIKDFAAQLRGEKPANPPLGNRQFPWSDVMIHQRAGWYASARGYSDRLANTDMPCNGEAMLSHHIADGCSILMKHGDEYTGIFPVWDWTLVPGTTAVDAPLPRGKDIRAMGRSPFVGGVSDGKYGAAAVDLVRDDLAARKSWFFFDTLYVCLGAGIRSTDGEHRVRTSIDQCRAQYPAVIGLPGGKTRKLLQAETVALPADVGWVCSGGVGYLLLGDRASAPATLQQGPQEGSWRRISDAETDKPVSMAVFSLWLDHGKAPTDARYAYAVVPEMAPTDEAAQKASSLVQILSNTRDLQAVRQTELGLTMAVFYDAKGGQVDLEPGVTLTVDRDCLVMARRDGKAWQVTVSRPEHQEAAVELAIGEGRGAVTLANGQSRTVTLPPK